MTGQPQSGTPVSASWGDGSPFQSPSMKSLIVSDERNTDTQRVGGVGGRFGENEEDKSFPQLGFRAALHWKPYPCTTSRIQGLAMPELVVSRCLLLLVGCLYGNLFLPGCQPLLDLLLSALVSEVDTHAPGTMAFLSWNGVFPFSSKKEGFNFVSEMEIFTKKRGRKKVRKDVAITNCIARMAPCLRMVPIEVRDNRSFAFPRSVRTPSIWEASGGSTYTLDSIWEETGQDCNSIRRHSRFGLQVVETSSQFLVMTSKLSRDDVRILIDEVKLTDLEEARRRFTG
ncbi:hypothetical protein Tco_0522565 [Tanacetum coccineum]